MAGTSIRIDGSDKANAQLAKAVEHLDNPTDLYTDIAVKLVGSVQYRFEIETDPEGVAWPASLRVMLQGGKTLQDTGFLVNSITYEVDDTGLAVGTNSIYAAIHQFGGEIKTKTKKGLSFRPLGANANIIVKSVTMPKRAFLGLNDEDEIAIGEFAMDYMAEPFSGDNHAR